MTHDVFVVQWEAAGSCWAVLPYKDNTNSVLFVDVSMMLYVMYFPVYRSKKDYYNFTSAHSWTLLTLGVWSVHWVNSQVSLFSLLSRWWFISTWNWTNKQGLDMNSIQQVSVTFYCNCPVEFILIYTTLLWYEHLSVYFSVRAGRVYLLWSFLQDY